MESDCKQKEKLFWNPIQSHTYEQASKHGDISSKPMSCFHEHSRRTVDLYTCS